MSRICFYVCFNVFTSISEKGDVWQSVVKEAGSRGEVRRYKIIFIAAVTATTVSVICCNISARVTFKKIDKYVADMVNLAKESIRDAHFNK